MELFQAAILSPDPDSGFDGLSFLGGTPAKGDQPWPLHPSQPGVPLCLVAQLDCRDLHAALPGNPLPSEGALQFYIDADTLADNEDRPPCRVVWQRDISGAEDLPVAGASAPEMRGIDVNAPLEDGQPARIGAWNFWHQALGRAPADLGGGPATRFPKTVDDVLLLRLVTDEASGLTWDGHHNPSLTFWITPGDLAAGAWESAYALLTDF